MVDSFGVWEGGCLRDRAALGRTSDDIGKFSGHRLRILNLQVFTVCTQLDANSIVNSNIPPAQQALGPLTSPQRLSPPLWRGGTVSCGQSMQPSGIRDRRTRPTYSGHTVSGVVQFDRRPHSPGLSSPLAREPRAAACLYHHRWSACPCPVPCPFLSGCDGCSERAASPRAQRTKSAGDRNRRCDLESW